MGAAFLVGYIVGWVVDLCFVWRIQQLSRRDWICVVLATLATARTGLNVVLVTVLFDDLFQLLG
ncbi:hypothetical protein PAXRUDRAFT_516279 [Paxillus rubicundulus Ve08.2h10]|uniref:Uncharacterized protein n=1 Tax=Paxillus rubicundulus Ve08.2h10 TaxID=930991 RepID=A0A0D0BU41_9AGAM|nr:hypothetical protein PAXRUDRAFT_516279 [Paxillus rubicundulus Ve08.2h10]